MRLRLILSFALISLVSIASVVLIARQANTREVNTFMMHGNMVGLEDLASTLENYYQANQGWQGVASLVRGPGSGRGMGGMMGAGGPGVGMMNQRLRLADASGNVLADTASSQPSGSLSQSELAGAIPLLSNGRTVGYLMAEGGFAFNPGAQTDLLNRLNRAALISAGAAGLLSLLLAFGLTYPLLQPIQELTQAARALAGGDLSRRVPSGGSSELSRLGDAFNQMAASLQQAEESRRAMTADIAHELRNPLAVQRAHLEALQDGIYPLTPDNLQPVLDQNQMLTRLVEDLRTLALADSGALSLEPIPTNTGVLLERLVERFRPQADAQQVQMDLDLPPAKVKEVVIDPGRTEQILSNLVSNALRYTPQGGVVKIRVEQSAYSLCIRVSDTGPGIPPEALPHLFERFYRADRSRSRSEGGTGLGLAIARQLAEAQGGALTAENQAGGGAVFCLTLPTQEKPKI